MSTFSICTEQEATNKTARGLYIADGDGNPRWVWPAASNTPTFLELFQPVTLRQYAFVAVVRLVFLLRLQRIIFAPINLNPERTETGTDWAVFTGTPGPNRKRITISQEGWVRKAAEGEMALANLDNEASFLHRLNPEAHQFSFITPQLLRQGDRGFTMEKLANKGTWGLFNAKHAKALGELRQIAPMESAVGQWGEWDNIRTRINQLRNTKHSSIPSGIVEDLLQLVVLEDMQPTITYGLAHGDFTPWNTLQLADDRLGIIDWELARTGMPAGFDFFHFHVQKGIMVERKTWQEIYADIREELTPAVREELFGTVAVSVQRYLRLYLIYHLSYYLSLYQQQAEWHQQIYWQLDVWSDALSALLPSEDQRKMLISRLFALLGEGGYAALKMAHDDPQELPIDSDLDLLIGRKEEANATIERLKSFPHIASCKVVRKSFMTSLFILLKNGQILNVDLIWKLKRKATVFMEVGSMIQNARRNGCGVLVVSPEDTQRYVGFFYGLNNSAVPAKFGQVEEAITSVHALPANKGFLGIGNRLAYLFDTLRTMIFNRGFVLTFSGVDGAGKSTVIEQVVTMLDKQFRRPVKVLRHRPSVLPILSAYRYGKEEAERKSVASLPRTGSNTSLLSSLIRFGYYYLDYLLGQWYVHFRYVLRGYVVVYDRYYYDFMIDSRRSNLELPSWITAIGFWFIKKPAFNFFLFADPDIILARKQELKRKTIVSLTQRYYSLFERQGRGRTSAVFTNIENVVLEDTLTVIRQTILQKNH